MNTTFDSLITEVDFFETQKEDQDEFFAEFGQIYNTGGGTNNYNKLINHPKIEGNTVIGDKTFVELGLLEITPQEIDDIFDELIYGGN